MDTMLINDLINELHTIEDRYIILLKIPRRTMIL